jgi:hypothetical protein
MTRAIHRSCSLRVGSSWPGAAVAVTDGLARHVVAVPQR